MTNGWVESETGEADVVIGECSECILIRGTRDLSVCLSNTEGLAEAQRRLAAHFAAVLHLNAPGLAW